MSKHDTELEEGKAYKVHHQKLGLMSVRVSAISPSHVQCQMLTNPEPHGKRSFSLCRNMCVFEPILHWDDRPPEVDTKP